LQLTIINARDVSPPGCGRQNKTIAAMPHRLYPDTICHPGEPATKLADMHLDAVGAWIEHIVPNDDL
jgi:hypothetical protein